MPSLTHLHHDNGLAADLQALERQALRRRRLLRGLLAAGAVTLVGCGGGGDADAAAETDATDGAGSSGSSGSAACSQIPQETAGPYPGDGSNTAGGAVANALALSGIVRSDIRPSIAGASGVAGGLPLTLIIDLVNPNASCADLAGYAIYLWHCDREGRYSMYSSGVTAENYLRGVQQTGADGTVTFQTIFPGCYAGRWPHMHFEIYRSLTTATSYSNKLRTSQIAFPADVCAAAYASAGYGSSAANLAGLSLASDGVFSDGFASQLASMSGDVAGGYTARLTVGLSA